ncbi:MAG: hypothetical protein GF331_26885, partial [Chitinivibrionales bacterium]|nr:hypothetical protein [Chitinivibrionales bacterium]
MTKTTTAPRPSMSTDNESTKAADKPAPLWRRPVFYAPAVLVASFLVYYHRLLLGMNHLWEDYLEQAYPNLRYSIHCIANGWFPLWNPYVFAGMPYHSDPQTTLFYLPYQLLLGVCQVVGNADLAFTWFILLHILLLGLGTYALTRDSGLGRMPAVLAAIVFMFAGFVSLHIMHTFVYVAAWFPWAFRSLRRSLRTGSLRELGLAGLFLGLSVLGGYPQYSLHIVYFMFAWSAVTVVAAGRRTWRAGVARAAMYGVVVAIGVGLAAVQYLPAFQHMAASVRETMTLEQSCDGSLTVPRLITLFAPKFFGFATGDRSLGSPFWAAPGKTYQFWETCIFVGIVPLLLVPFAAIRFRSSREVRFYSIAAAVLLVLALGCSTPLYPLLFKLAPGFGRFRIPARFSFLLSLCLAMLAAYGLQELLRGERGKGQRRALLVSAGIVAAIWGLGLLFLSGAFTSASQYLSAEQVAATARRAVGVAMLVSGLGIAAIAVAARSDMRVPAAVALVALAFFDLYAFGSRFGCGTMDPKRYYEGVDLSDLRRRAESEGFRIQSRLYAGEGKGEMLLPRNLGSVQRLPLVEGYNQLQLSRFSGSLFRVNPRVSRKLFTVGFIKAPGRNSLRALEPPPRFYLSTSYEVRGTTDAVIESLHSAGFVPGRDVVLETAPRLTTLDTVRPVVGDVS